LPGSRQASDAAVGQQASLPARREEQIVERTTDCTSSRKRLATLLIVSVVVLLGACRRAPSAGQIVGAWKSTNGAYAIDFRRDGTYTFTKAVRPTSFHDMIGGLGFLAITPSGRWKLEQWELSMTCVSSPEMGISILFKIVSWRGDSLSLQFGDGEAVRFVRQQQPSQ
jgi:hypothetical protein